MNKFWQVYAWGTLFIAFAFILILSYWYLYPYKPLIINSLPLDVVTETVSPGENLVYKVDACKTMHLTSEISRSFVDTVIYNTALIRSENPVGCNENTVSIPVPRLPSGIYRLKILYSYQVNPIRQVTIEALSERFTIK